MADKGFGVEEVNLIGASGTPTIESPNNLNLDANTVAISTNATIGGWFTSELRTADGYNVGVGTTVPSDPAHSSNTTILNAGIVTANYIYGDGSNLTNVIGVGTGVDIQSFDAEVGTATTINFGKGLFIDVSTSKGIVTVTSSSSGGDNIFSSLGGVYASHSETSNGAYSLVGIGSTYVELPPIFEANAGSYDYYGATMACSADGNTVIIGAFGDEISGGANSETGLVYVYDRVGTFFNLVGILTGTNTQTYDFFGADVACSASGKTIVVGASVGNSPNTNTDSGVAYIFDRDGNNFNVIGILTGRHSTDEFDAYGNTVACSADGNVIAISAPRSEIPGANSADGMVYVYDRDGNNFNEVGILTGTGGDFGGSLAINANGSTIVVGASTAFHPILTTTKTGMAYVYDRQFTVDATGSVGIGTTYSQVGILTGTYSTEESDYYGGSVATNADGSTIIIGAFGDEIDAANHKGVVYVYDRESNSADFINVGLGTTFREVGILTGSNPSNSSLSYAFDYFGSRVDCSADGNIIAVSAPGDEIEGSNPTPSGSGVIYTFNRHGDIFTEVGIITSSFDEDVRTQLGHSLACSKDMKHIYAGKKAPGLVPDFRYVIPFDQATVANDQITIREDGILINGDLNVTGDITAFYTSDERLKDDITLIEDPLAKVISISGNTFNWNDKSKKRGNDTGLIAQEVESLKLPGLVVTRDNGYLAVDYHKVVPLLVEAIKELSEDRNIITSKNGVKYRLVVDDDGNLSTEKV